MSNATGKAIHQLPPMPRASLATDIVAIEVPDGNGGFVTYQGTLDELLATQRRLLPGPFVQNADRPTVAEVRDYIDSVSSTANPVKPFSVIVFSAASGGVTDDPNTADAENLDQPDYSWVYYGNGVVVESSSHKLKFDLEATQYDNGDPLTPVDFAAIGTPGNPATIEDAISEWMEVNRREEVDMYLYRKGNGTDERPDFLWETVGEATGGNHSFVQIPTSAGTASITTYDTGHGEITGTPGITVTKNSATGIFDVVMPSLAEFGGGFFNFEPNDCNYSNDVSDGLKIRFTDADGNLMIRTPKVFKKTASGAVSVSNPMRLEPSATNDSRLDEMSGGVAGWVFPNLGSNASAGGFISF